MIGHAMGGVMCVKGHHIDGVKCSWVIHGWGRVWGHPSSDNGAPPFRGGFHMFKTLC